jgi:membrane-associated protease RseP (regulator of RpoE activity)
MGSSSSDLSGPERPTPGYAALQRDYVPPAPEPEVRRRPIVRHLVLFVATVVTTTAVGMLHYQGFLDIGARPALPEVLFNGFLYSASVLGILGAHEMGHYLACRYYRIDASLPYFLPAPLLAGTLGAFIRIRQPIPNKRELFDIGIAGPIAGFLVAVPLLWIGVGMSRLIQLPDQGPIGYYGEPLLLKGMIWLIWGARPPGFDIVLHPVGFAGWFGLLATLLNLFPFGQLDGGHVCYAVLGRKSTYVSYATLGCLVALTAVSFSWVAWTLIMVAMMYFFGPHNPRTHDEDTPLDAGRMVLAGFAVVMFVLCFMPDPIGTVDLVPGETFTASK